MKKLLYIGSNMPGQADLIGEIEALGYETTLLSLIEGGEDHYVNTLCDECVQKSVQAVMEKIGQVDMLVLDSRVPGCDKNTFSEGPDWSEAEVLYERYFFGYARFLHELLPYMDKAGDKRICYLTDKASSLQACRDTGAFGSHIAMAAVNMMAKEMFNHLQPRGYTLRSYCFDGDLDYIADYFTRDQNLITGEEFRSGEYRFVMRTDKNTEIPW